MKHVRLILAAALLLAPCSRLVSQTTSMEAVKKVTATDAISEDLNFLTGRTLTIGAGATFSWNATAVFSGSASAFRTAIGAAIGTNVEAWDADLDALAALSGTNTIYYRSGAATWTAVTISAPVSFSAGALGLSGTAAQFNTACSNDDFAFLGLANVFTDTTAATASTGAQKSNGGVCALKDSFFNSVRIGRGPSGDIDSVAIGNTPAAAATVGTSNITIGTNSLGHNTSGTNNVAVGGTAGYLSYGGPNLTTPDHSVFIGDTASSGASGTTTTNEVVIGGSSAQGYGSYSTVLGGPNTTRGEMFGKGMNRGYLFGLRMANGTDATNDIDIAPGEARDSTGILTLQNASTITKQLDAAWAAGSAAGGLDQGSIANATYHVHIIGDSHNLTDVIYSLSHDRSDTVTMTIASPCVVTMGTTNRGHGLVAGSPFKFTTTGGLPTGVLAGTQYYVLAPTETTFTFSTTNGGSAVNSSGGQSGTHTCLPGPKMPNGYTYFRRIGSIVRAGATILAFQQDNDRFALTTPVLDFSSATVTTARTTATLASIPTGLRLRPIVRINGSSATGGVMFVVQSLDETDAAPSATVSPIYTQKIEVAGVDIAGFEDLITNCAAQVATRASAASTTVHILTKGWWDTRGRLDQ